MKSVFSVILFLAVVPGIFCSASESAYSSALSSDSKFIGATDMAGKYYVPESSLQDSKFIGATEMAGEYYVPKSSLPGGEFIGGGAMDADTVAADMEKPAGKRKRPVEAGIGMNLVSSYLWRGSQLDKASLQPDMWLGWEGLTLDVWGSVGVVGDLSMREIDLSLSYEIKGFSIRFTDYYCPAAENNLFFSAAPHTLEVGIGYACRFLAVNWYTNVFNDDDYSSYLEISAPFTLGPVDFSAALGCSPYHSDFYGTKSFNVINCSITAGHEFSLGPVTIPLSAQLMVNPTTSKAFFAASVGLSF